MYHFIKEFGFVGLIAISVIGVPVIFVSYIFCEIIYLGFYPVTSQVSNIHTVFLIVSVFIGLIVEFILARFISGEK